MSKLWENTVGVTGERPDPEQCRMISEVTRFLSPAKHTKTAMMRVGLLRMRSVFKASVFVTTGGTEGIRLEEIPIHERARAHHERLRLSEFGLVCLWSLVDSSLLEIYPVGQDPSFLHRVGHHCVVLRPGTDDTILLRFLSASEAARFERCIRQQMQVHSLVLQPPLLQEPEDDPETAASVPESDSAAACFSPETGDIPVGFSHGDCTYTIRGHPEEAEFQTVANVRMHVFALGPVIPATDGVAIAEFERVRPRILRILGETCSGPCWLLTATRQDCPTSPLSIPTIVLLCSKPDSCRAQLEEIDSELRFLVAMGGPVLLGHNIGYSQRVPMGGSIGVKGVLSSGTLGGYIFDRTTEKQYGLTNGHVARMQWKGRKLAMPVIITETEQVTIVQNSDEDFGQQRTDIMQNLAHAVEVDQVYGGTHPRWSWERARAQAELDKHEKHDRELGTVKFGNMSIVDSETPKFKCWKDVGVVDIKPDRLGKSLSDPNTPTSLVYGHMPIVAGMHVLKLGGRTTRSQEGVVNGVMADCRMACPLVKDSPAFSTREWVVIGPALAKPISTAGDSGTFFVRKPEDVAPPVHRWMLGAAHATSPLLSQRDGGLGTQAPPASWRAPVVGVMFGGAYVTWPQLMEGDGAVVTHDQKEIDKACHGTLSEPDPLYGAEITIITPASTILGWLAKDLGSQFEFGHLL